MVAKINFQHSGNFIYYSLIFDGFETLSVLMVFEKVSSNKTNTKQGKRMVGFISPKDFCLTVVLFLAANMICVDADTFNGALEVITSKSELTVSQAQKISDLNPEEKKQTTHITRYTESKSDQVIGLSTNQSSTRSNTNGSSNKSDLFPELTRHRRSTTTFSIDVAAVVDYWVYSSFLTAARGDRTAALKNIREYYAFIFDGVDKLFQSLNTYFIIRVYLSQVLVIESRELSPLAGINHINNNIEAEEAMDAIKNFVAQNSIDLETVYDHAMFFTGFNQENGMDPKFFVYSYKSTICETDGRSVSLVEDIIKYQSIRQASAALAFSLSANSDGDGNRCSKADRYIMGDVSSPISDWNMYHPWQFSPCSVASFTSYLQQQLKTSRGATCLNDHTPRDNTIPDVSGRLLGQEVNANQQCQATFGPDSKICVGNQKNGSALCQALNCLKPGTEMCNMQAALDGTTCGDGKICRSGQCVSDQQAPTVDDSCMFGDTFTPVFKGKYCQQFVSEFPGLCYVAINIALCCTSCQTVHRNVKNCEYGDKSKECTSEHCSQYPSECCGTCKNGEPYIPPAKPIVKYVPRPSNENPDPTDDACRNREWSCFFLHDDVKWKCYDRVFNRNCCQFCRKKQVQKSGCEYGDQSPQLCQDKSICRSSPSLCCQLCAVTSSTTNSCSGHLTILSTIFILFQTLLICILTH